MRAIRVTTRTRSTSPSSRSISRSAAARRCRAASSPSSIRRRCASRARNRASLAPQRLDAAGRPLLDIVGRARCGARSGRERATEDASDDEPLRAAAHAGPRRPAPSTAAATRTEGAVPRRQARRCPQVDGARRDRRSRDVRRSAPRRACSSMPRLRSRRAATRSGALAPPVPDRRAGALPSPGGAQMSSADVGHGGRGLAGVGRGRARSGLGGAGTGTRPHPAARGRPCRLRDDSLAQQKTIGALQAACARPKAIATSTGFVYSLASAAVFFALLAAALWALRPRQRGRARWFEAQAQQQKRAAAAAAAAIVRRAPPRLRPRPGDQPAPVAMGRERPRLPAGDGAGDDRRPRSDDGARAAVALRAHGRSRRIGQRRRSDRDAGHCRRRRKADRPRAAGRVLRRPRPGRGGDRAARPRHLGEIGGGEPVALPAAARDPPAPRRSRRLRGRCASDFHDHFNAFAPEWSTDLQFGRSLEEYPQAMARLQALWPTPLHAMRTLDGLLFRRNEDDETFDFPAYRELLFLYSVARELAGRSRPTSARSTCSCRSTTRRPMHRRATTPGGASTSTSRGWPDDSRPEGLVIRRSAGQARRRPEPSAGAARPTRRRSERAQARQGEIERLVLLGEAEADDALLEAVGVERRQRNRRDADLASSASGRTSASPQVAHRRVVDALEVGALAGQQPQPRARQAGAEPVALGAGRTPAARGRCDGSAM